MQLRITNCHLSIFQDIYLLARVSVYIGDDYTIYTDRRPNPNAAQSGSLTSGLSFPSFEYRSGWNSSGLLKTLRIIIIGPFRNIVEPLVYYSSSIIDMWGIRSDIVRIVVNNKRPTKGYYEIPTWQFFYNSIDIWEKEDRENLGDELGRR